MHIQIQSKGGTESREVADLDEAQALADSGLTVLVRHIDGGHRLLEASSAAPGMTFKGVPLGFSNDRLPPEYRAAKPVKSVIPKAPVAKRASAAKKAPAKTAKKK